jgi:uncharacterized protein (DUF2062 family)
MSSGSGRLFAVVRCVPASEEKKLKLSPGARPIPVELTRHDEVRIEHAFVRQIEQGSTMDIMIRWFPSRESLMRSRWLGPLAHHFQDESLWQVERGSIARGVAIGLFFGLLLPLAQFLFAVAFAILLRGHVAVAAAATLVSNPLTFAPLYWLAHRIGSALLGSSRAEARVHAAMVEAQVEVTAAAQGWLRAIWEAVLNAGAPLLLGLAVMAVAGAVLGFLVVWLMWRPRRDGRPNAG